MSLVIGNILLFVCVIIELLFMRYSKKEAIPWKEVVTNINSGHILMWIFRSLAISAYQLSLHYFNLHIVDSWPRTTQWIFGFFAWDFCFYWSHRFHHLYPVLWAVHVVHHEGEHFNLSLGIRNSWYSSITSFPFFFILTILGVPLHIFVLVSGVHYFVQFYNHNHFVKKSGWLEYILITPSHHRVHHGKNDLYIDKNFGGTFVFWDKLFGSFQHERTDVPVQFGVQEPTGTMNTVLVNNIPFLKLLRGKKRSQNNLYSISNVTYFTVAGTFLLICLLLWFIYAEKTMVLIEKVMLFFIIFLGTIGNGIFCENRLLGFVVWIVSSVVLNIVFLSWLTSTPVFLKVILFAYLFHSCFLAGLMLLKLNWKHSS